MRYQFIADHREAFPVRRMCQVLKVSSSGYYAWRKRPVSPREMANQELIEEIKATHEESYDLIFVQTKGISTFSFKQSGF
jgi:putative transposase